MLSYSFDFFREVSQLEDGWTSSTGNLWTVFNMIYSRYGKGVQEIHVSFSETLKISLNESINTRHSKERNLSRSWPRMFLKHFPAIWQGKHYITILQTRESRLGQISDNSFSFLLQGSGPMILLSAVLWHFSNRRVKMQRQMWRMCVKNEYLKTGSWETCMSLLRRCGMARQYKGILVFLLMPFQV